MGASCSQWDSWFPRRAFLPSPSLLIPGCLPESLVGMMFVGLLKWEGDLDFMGLELYFIGRPGLLNLAAALAGWLIWILMKPTLGEGLGNSWGWGKSLV